MAVSHVLSSPIADFTGTVTVFNSAGVTTTANATQIVRPSDWNSVHNQYVTLTGNTAGQSTVSGTNIIFSGGANVTLSGSNGSIGFVGPTQTNQSIGVYGVSNTTQSSSGTIDARSLSFQGAGAASVGVSNGSVVISVAAGAQTNQTMGLYGSSQTTGQSSSSTVDARSLSIVGAGGVSVGMSGGSLIVSGGAAGAGGPAISAGTQSVSTGTMVFSNSNNISFGMSGSSRVTASYNFNVSGGTTSNNLNSVVFSNSNGVSFGLNGSTVTGSVAAQTNQSVGIYASSQTTGASSSSTADARSISLVGAGAISAGWTNGSFIISSPDTTSLPVQSVGFSTGGNTAGTTGFGTDQVVLAGGANITLSGSTNAGSLTISIVGGAGGGGGVAISAGTQSVSTGTMVFSNSNNITFGMSGSSRITASFSQTNQTVGLYALGNTTQNSSSTMDARTLSYNALGAMTMGFSNGSIQVSAPATSSLSATGNVSISTNGGTISIGAPGQMASRFDALPLHLVSLSSSGQTNSAYTLQYLQIPMDALSFSRVDIPINVSLSSSGTTNTAAFAVSAMVVLYSKNGSTLSPIVGSSQSQTLSWASNTSNFSNLTGPRMFSFPLATSIPNGDYWLGFYMSTSSGISSGASTTALNATLNMYLGTVLTASNFADINSATNSSVAPVFHGLLSSVPTNTSQTLQLSQFTVNGGSDFRANVPIILRNV